jgi:hypothetical protein
MDVVRNTLARQTQRPVIDLCRHCPATLVGDVILHVYTETVAEVTTRAKTSISECSFRADLWLTWLSNADPICMTREN